jgi:hypothetical protein
MSLTRVLAAAALVAAAAATVLTAPSAQAHTTPGHRPRDSRPDYTFAVIGDVPYGEVQLAAFPSWIAQINADPDVRSVVHLGDIKNGSSLCSDAYFATIRADFDTFEDPLVYTPGDNEWTDCHRVNNGAYDPLERLAKVRELFFDRPGRSLGQRPMRVHSQARQGFAENVIYRRRDVTFLAANVTGSNNGLQPWSGLGNTEATPEQVAAVQARTEADIRLLHRAFRQAREAHDRGVVVMQQADMFDPTYTPTPADIGAFTPWVQALVEESSRFRGPVYLLDGDSHVYNTDRPLASGSGWLSTYGIDGTADNLTRVTVDGSANNVDWLRVRINPRGSADLLSWERVPYSG